MESCPVLTPLTTIERLAAGLLPPDDREHIVGDLCERYRSPGHFVSQVLRALPFVLIARIRRTTLFLLWPLLAGVMATQFRSGSEQSWTPGFVAAFIVLVGYMLRDAYRRLNPPNRWRQGLVDAAVVTAVFIAAEFSIALFEPSWAVTSVGTSRYAMVMAVLTFLRAQVPSSTERTAAHG